MGHGARIARATMFALVCVPFAALGHAVMSGATVPVWAMLAAGIATAAGAWTLAGRERGRPVVVTATVTAQMCLHALFSLGQAVALGHRPGAGPFVHRWVSVVLCRSDTMARASQGAARAAAATGRRMSGMAGGPAHPSVAAMPGTAGSMPGMHGGNPVGMIAAHLLVAAVCGLWLAHGERAVFRIGRVAAGRLLAPLLLILWSPRPLGPPASAAPAAYHRPVRFLWLAHAVTTRGPPGTPVAVPATV